MKMMHRLLTTAACAVLAWPALGGVTTSRAPVGGPGSCSSEGFNDPGLLADGVTVGAASYDFTLNTGAGTLTLVVNNNSTVTPGVPNPVLTQIYFNAPVQISGMNLLSQTSTGGANPAFGFNFDSNLFSNPNPNKAANFGAFSVGLKTVSGVQGGVANPLADVIGGPDGAAAIGPVTFVFGLTGTLTGVTSNNFALTSSVIPPGNKPSNTAGHFQAGGVGAQASAFISNAVEDCYLLISQRTGDGTFIGPEPNVHPFPIQLSDPTMLGSSFLAPIQIPILQRRYVASMVGMNPVGTVLGDPSLGAKVLDIRAQMVMWNPTQFPAEPEQYSYGLDVTVWSNGFMTSVPFGTGHGMELSAVLEYTAEGRPYVRFPFTLNDF